MSTIIDPAILFFIFGVFAGLVKSNLEIPQPITRFLSLYLLMALGLKGGFALHQSGLTLAISISLGIAMFLACAIPLVSYYFLKTKLSALDSAAIAATYGSVSAVTFVTGMAFLEMNNMKVGGEMVAVMASMEFPAIIMGVILMNLFPGTTQSNTRNTSWRSAWKHSLTNGSVLMIFGSLVIGFIADSNQSEGIKHFTSDIFKGFLAIYLLDMGMVAASRFSAFKKQGAFLICFAILMPLVNGVLTSYLSQFVTENEASRLIFAILAASASYIAVPAAMRLVAPKADPGIFIPMALGVTFPINITIGLPLFLHIIHG